MRNALHTVLIWMLMLALPAQSMAAISMQLCAVTQQGVAMAQVDAPSAMHHPRTMVMSTVQMPDMFAPPTHHASSSSAESLSNTAKNGDNSVCSLCAFCVGAVALGDVIVSNTPLQTAEPLLARLDQFVGVVAEPLERPPRSLLA